MLTQVLRYENLGSFKEIVYIMKQALSASKFQDISNIKKYCISKNACFAYSFDGIISLLNALSLVEIKKKKIKVNGKAINLEKDLNSKPTFLNIIVGPIFEQLKNQYIVSRFIPPVAIQYDFMIDKIIISNSSIPLEFQGLKNFLINMDFLQIDKPPKDLLLINPAFQLFFEKQVIPCWRQETTKNISLGMLSYDDFKRLQSIKEQHGKDAEQFVLTCEQERLLNHPEIGRIKIISDIDVRAGYDIVSFNSVNSQHIDRFIEVKAYTDKTSFYWSRRELETAILRGNNYFIYLVGIDKKSKKCSKLVIIQNPYKNIFLDKRWLKREEKWFILQI